MRQAQGAAVARIVGRQADALPRRAGFSKLFVMERISTIAALDIQRITTAIEGTRFPPIEGQRTWPRTASIVPRSAFIGQLGEPNYIRKPKRCYMD